MIKEIIAFLFIVIVFFGLGWSGCEIYYEMQNKKILNGLYIWNAHNISEVKDYARSRDSNGDWVCINVAYEMKPEVAYKTCVHECSHKAFSEIYAERCEADPIKCMKELNG